MSMNWTAADVDAVRTRNGLKPLTLESKVSSLTVRGWPGTYLIGIDCGVQTGYAIWDRAYKSYLTVDTMTITQAIFRMHDFRSTPGGIFVRFEDARLRKIIPYQKSDKWERGVREGAGSVKRDASVWEGYLIENGIPYQAVAPKDNTTKLEADTFKRMTGWSGRTSEHARDAAMLVFGL